MHSRLKQVRKFLKLNQADFAKRLGVGTRTYQEYEYGNTELKLSVLAKLKELGININWLIDGEGSMLVSGSDLDVLDQTSRKLKHVIDDNLKKQEEIEELKKALLLKLQKNGKDAPHLTRESRSKKR